MAIRDGLAIDLDGAKTEAVVRKGRLRYVAPRPPPGSRRLLTILAAILVLVVLFGAAYYFYTQRDVQDSLKLEAARTDFAPGEEISVTVSLQNTGPRPHRYLLTTSQSFGLEIRNATGGIVAEYAPAVTPEARELTVEPGETLRLGTFSWNQTALSRDGANETWTQVPSGEYVIRAFFKGSADIAAEKRITIG